MPHNASYNHHFIIKQLAKEFEGQFECLGENSEKYITFSVPIKACMERKEIKSECDNIEFKNNRM